MKNKFYFIVILTILFNTTLKSQEKKEAVKSNVKLADSYNTSYGTGAFIVNVTGNYNCAFGNQSLYQNESGNLNSAFGNSSLKSNTSGNYNSAFGSDALRSNKTGRDNTAIGNHTLVYNTTGIENIAIGSNAMYLNTTGSKNVAVGSRALYSNNPSSSLPKSGTSNTAIGWEALKSNTTGLQNTAVGESALTSNIIGEHNTGIGEDVLYKNNASFNTAVGESALYDNIIGRYNHSCGFYSLNHSTGNYNIALGFLAGQKLTSGNGNIYIGNIGKLSESNVIRIGNTSSVIVSKPVTDTIPAQTSTYIAGISGVNLTGTASQVYVNSDGQLGVQSASMRFKEEINLLNIKDQNILKLRPVTFKYITEKEKIEEPLQYGLLAEEVAELIPELVQFDSDGKPFAVNYQFLTPLLLAQVQKHHQDLLDQNDLIQKIKKQNDLLLKEINLLKQQASLFKPEKR